MNTRISFLMPTFNRAEYILESLASVQRNMSSCDEIIVIDDGSTDNTRQIVAGLSDQVTYLYQENAGKSVALNRGLLKAKGDYIWIVDDDDILNDGSVKTLTAAIETHDVDMVFGKYTRFKTLGDSEFEFDGGYWPDLTQGSIVRHLMEDDFIFHNAALVRKSAYDRAGPFNTKLLRSQDYDMFLRLALTSKTHFIDESIFRQRQHDGLRGPAKVLHSAKNSQNVWNQYDAVILQNLREAVSLIFFEHLFEGGTASLRKRAALLQRACIMGRHTLWPLAIDDIAAAIAIEPSQPLHGLERAILGRAVNGKAGFDGLIDRDNRAQLTEILAGSPLATQILGSIGNGMVWQLRKESQTGKLNAIKFFTNYGLIKTLPGTLSARLSRRHEHSNGSLVERTKFDPLNARDIAKF